MKTIGLYRYGESAGLPGLTLGVAHYPPRGVRKTDYAARGYFEVWTPLVAPSSGLVAAFHGDEIDFKTFARRYRTEMKRPESRHTIELLAAIAKREPINLGCYCEDENRCHRSLLRELIAEAAGGE